MFRIYLVFIFAQAGETVECGTFVHHAEDRNSTRLLWKSKFFYVCYSASICVLRILCPGLFHPKIKSKSFLSYFPKENLDKSGKTLPATFVRSVMAEDIILKCLSWVQTSALSDREKFLHLMNEALWFSIKDVYSHDDNDKFIPFKWVSKWTDLFSGICSKFLSRHFQSCQRYQNAFSLQWHVTKENDKQALHKKMCESIFKITKICCYLKNLGKSL